MIFHFDCEPLTKREKRWIFDWDDEAGEVTGPDSDEIKKLLAWME